jgi:hypothetical protein
MKSRLLLLTGIMALALLMQGLALAQSRTDLVCWANEGQVTNCPQEYRARIFPCGSGGHSGFNPNYVCQQICGADRGPRCRITGGPGGGGGQCGYRAAKVDCFN